MIQFDSDAHASTFDSVVAIDSGIDHLITQANVGPDQITSLVHGAMFTRGPADLKHTALFFGGSDVVETEAIFEAAKKCFFGPLRVSMMADPNGSNTTAAAAVISAQNHISLDGKTIAILAGTGPVGQKIARLIAGPASSDNKPPIIRVCSRRLEKAKLACSQLAKQVAGEFVPFQTSDLADALAAVAGADIVFAAGAAGIELLNQDWMSQRNPASVAVDINAVPPAGIFGIDVMDSGAKRGETTCYGAIGVGTLKMKIHKQALKMLFESNDQVLEVEQIFKIGLGMDK